MGENAEMQVRNRPLDARQAQHNCTAETGGERPLLSPQGRHTLAGEDSRGRAAAQIEG